MSSDLVAFLRARLDEDERNARERRGIFPSPGVDDDGAVWLHIRPGGNAVITRYAHPVDGYDDMAKLRNWADTDSGWTDVRVLREVEAKRRIITEYEEHARLDRETFDAEGGHARSLSSLRAAYWDACRHLAAVHADHPDYRDDWRP